MAKLTKKRRIQKAATKTAGALHHVAMTKWSAEDEKKFRARRLGRFGAASGVRKIDPASYKPSE